MWYVIQVQTGREEQIMEEARSYQVQEYFDEIFAPRASERAGRKHQQDRPAQAAGLADGGAVRENGGAAGRAGDHPKRVE